MKIILTVLCVVALATLANTHSATWGRRNSTDSQIFYQNEIRYPNNYTQVANVAFPRFGQSNFKNITEILVLDNVTNSTGATPSLLSGGPGWKFANIALTSQYKRGINCTIIIYGK